jgi:NitT/TauT family transport system permease protein
MKMNRLYPWLLLLALLLGWEMLCTVFRFSALVLPAPSVVLAALWRGLNSGYLGPHLWQTLLELTLGLLSGCVLGFTSGILMAEIPGLRRILMPYVVTSQVVPKLALAPLFIFWFGFGTLPIVVMTSLICFFPLLENTLTSLQQIDANRLELFRMLGATRPQTLWRLKIPAGLPVILAGLRVAVVLALVGAVVGEFVGASKGLGALIIAAQGSMDTPLMFAVLLLITLLGLTLYQLTLVLEQWLLRPYTRTV